MNTQTNYPGIDYSRGLSNCDAATQIRYGVISQNSVNPDALDDIMTHGEDLAWKEALADAIKEVGEDADEDAISEELGMCWESSLSNYLYEQDGYKLTGCLNSDLFVLASPFFTYAQFCSPCVPGAGNLDSPFRGLAVPKYEAPGWQEDFRAEAEANGFPRVYCLGHDWFEHGAPYAVFSVATGKLVTT